MDWSDFNPSSLIASINGTVDDVSAGVGNFETAAKNAVIDAYINYGLALVVAVWFIKTISNGRK